jgi:hypothetical protein
MTLRPRRTVLAVTVIGLAVSCLTMIVGPAFAQPDFEVVASGLLSPRLLSFSPKGKLYVVEAGNGGTSPCAIHPVNGEYCFGFTGGVTEVRDNGPDPRVVSGLPSISNGTQPIGPSDIAFHGSKYFVLSIGLGGGVAYRDAFGDDGALLGTLVFGSPGDDEVTPFADVLANEADANPDGTDIDCNPVGFFIEDGNNLVLADAGGNAVVAVTRKGVFSTVTALPPGSALAPPFLGLPPGTQIPTDAVPTSVVRGPDKAYYISQLTGFPFEKGDANIWRVVPGQSPTVYASGLTNLTDLEFAEDGTLYAVEISSDGILTGLTGALVKITPGASEHETVLGDLFAPYGVAIRDGFAYVTTCSVCDGGGQVIKIELD